VRLGRFCIVMLGRELVDPDWGFGPWWHVRECWACDL